MTNRAESSKALLYTLLSSLDSDAQMHVELKSLKNTLHFGTSSRLDDADTKLELKTALGEEDEIRNLCYRASPSSLHSKSADLKAILEEPGEKTLYIEIRKSPSAGGGCGAKSLHTNFLSLSDGHRSCSDVYESTRLADYMLQSDHQFLEIESGAGHSNVDDMQRPGSANEELLETAHAIVNMADLKSNTVLPQEYHEDGTPRRRQKVAVEPKELVGIPKECPRCNSKEVKFKYFNNKKLNQPRYQCLSCKDFFTHGGKKLATEAASPSASVQLMLPDGSFNILPIQSLDGKGKERKRKAKEPPQFAGMEKLCRKCGSKNTAFKYLNNGQLDQPRYKCLDCKGMFQLHNKRVRPSSSGDVNTAALLSDLSKETTSVESASVPLESSLLICGPRVAKQTERKRKAMEPEHLVGVVKPCPSCKKTKTRFKYFNNKNMKQPRYECLDCHQYFTYKTEFNQVNSGAFGGDQGFVASITAVVNEGNSEGPNGSDRNGRDKEVEGNTSLTGRSDSERIYEQDLLRLNGEGDANAINSGHLKDRMKDGGSGLASSGFIGTNMRVRDTGEVINVRRGLGQVEREGGQGGGTALEVIGFRRMLDLPGSLEKHDKVFDSTGVKQQ